jgi:hypothetical protein
MLDRRRRMILLATSPYGRSYRLHPSRPSNHDHLHGALGAPISWKTRWWALPRDQAMQRYGATWRIPKGDRSAGGSLVRAAARCISVADIVGLPCQHNIVEIGRRWSGDFKLNAALCGSGQHRGGAGVGVNASRDR